MRAINVLSLFDGVSCARVALERANIKVNSYFASEIDKYCVAVVKYNNELKKNKDQFYPMTKQLGDVRYIKPSEAPKNVDLLIGGSPCQDLSISKKNRKGLEGERSGLFWDYVRIKKQLRPKWFILENVASMSKESKNIISEALGVEPIMINASLVSAQNRKRLFWTNIPNVIQPKDRKIYLRNILEEAVKEKYSVNAVAFRGRNIVDGKRKDVLGAKTQQCIEIGGEKANTITSVYKDSMVRIGSIGKGGQGERIYDVGGKSVSLSALGGGRGAKTGLYEDGSKIRRLTPLECERLQGLPDNYTHSGLWYENGKWIMRANSEAQKYKMLGNAFNVDVVAHILSFIPR